VASQSKLAVGRLHRPAMALLATPTAAFPPVPLATDCDPAARDPGAAGIFGIAFFVSSYLCNLAWMRWVAAGWWGAALLLYAFRHRLEVLPLSAVLILLLLALPGLLLWHGRPAGA
jgi:hypothetical protein